LFLLLTYLLAYLKVINPQISGIAAAMITKLYGPNASPRGCTLLQFGWKRKYLRLLPVENAVLPDFWLNASSATLCALDYRRCHLANAKWKYLAQLCAKMIQIQR
jgi:hypothetical protein